MHFTPCLQAGQWKLKAFILGQGQMRAPLPTREIEHCQRKTQIEAEIESELE